MKKQAKYHRQTDSHNNRREQSEFRLQYTGAHREIDWGGKVANSPPPWSSGQMDELAQL